MDLQLGKFETRRPTLFLNLYQFTQNYIKMSFTQPEHRSQLLCGLDFANERLLLCQFCTVYTRVLYQQITVMVLCCASSASVWFHTSQQSAHIQ